jgi:N-acylneuraminate cytidylyltransferase
MKNIRPIGGVPLIVHTIRSAHAAKALSDVVVSTDDPEIFQVARQFGAEPPFLRPATLATDLTASIDVILHALDFYEGNGDRYDAVCLLQPTSPFRADGFIDRAIAKFESSNADSLVSVLKVPHEYNPHWVFEDDGSGRLKIATGEAKIVTRRQDLPEAYHRDGSVYLTKTSVLRSGSLYGDSVSYIENDPRLHVNIDTPDDWALAEQLAKKICAAS